VTYARCLRPLGPGEGNGDGGLESAIVYGPQRHLQGVLNLSEWRPRL
jgi:hypothetical protein